jgi:hypothetical protein
MSGVQSANDDEGRIESDREKMDARIKKFKRQAMSNLFKSI